MLYSVELRSHSFELRVQRYALFLNLKTIQVFFFVFLFFFFHFFCSTLSSGGLAAVWAQPRHLAEPALDAYHIAQPWSRAQALLVGQADAPHRRPVLEQTPPGRPLELQVLARSNRRTTHRYPRRCQRREAAARTPWQPCQDGANLRQVHPYFPKSCKGCKFNTGLKNRLRGWLGNAERDCYWCKRIKEAIPEVNLAKIRERRKYIIEYSNEVPKELSHPDFNRKITISKKAIKEWTNQPHGAMLEKNELILEIERCYRKQST